MLTACGEKGVELNPDKPQQLEIVTTIKPIQAIVAAIVNDNVDSFQLIPDYASPHDYSFKPSDISRVKNANIIFRIDEHMEVMLNPVFENLNAKTRLVSLAEEGDIKLLPVTKASKAVKDDQHNHGNIDFHIWTSPKNALVMAKSIAKTLVELDPINASSYQQNLDSFSQQLDQVTSELSKALVKAQHKQYIVFHDSWQYFATEFQLQEPVVVNLHEGLTPGVKSVSEIRQKIEADHIGCIFYDQDVAPAQLALLSDKQSVKTIEIDVLARKLEVNKDTYLNWLQNMGQQISACLNN